MNHILFGFFFKSLVGVIAPRPIGECFSFVVVGAEVIVILIGDPKWFFDTGDLVVSNKVYKLPLFLDSRPLIEAILPISNSRRALHLLPSHTFIKHARQYNT